MLVSFAHRFIYFSVPKTASTTTSRCFEPFCLPPGREVKPGSAEIISDTGIVGARGKRHLSADPEWRWHMGAARAKRLLDRDSWNGFLKFANIRNPFTQMLSAFFFLRERGELPELDHFDDTRTAFAAFTNGEHQRGRRRGRRVAELCSIDGELVLDDVIPVEALEPGILRVAKRLGLPLTPGDVGHHRKNQNPDRQKPLTHFYDDASVERILSDFAWVFDTFGYSRSLEDSHLPPEWSAP